jgi:hypothetical protein
MQLASMFHRAALGRNALMALDAISESYAALFATMRPRTGNSDASAGEEFAAFLPDDTRVQPAPAKSDMVSRILLVGILRYAEEQKEVEKMMWVLSLVHIESDDEVRAELDKIIEQFKKNEPANGEDTLTRIKAYIDEMPNGALKLRMLKAFERITELMAQPDEDLEQLDRELSARKRITTTKSGAPMPAQVS